jgi:hypothetical protein
MITKQLKARPILGSAASPPENRSHLVLEEIFAFDLRVCLDRAKVTSDGPLRLNSKSEKTISMSRLSIRVSPFGVCLLFPRSSPPSPASFGVRLHEPDGPPEVPIEAKCLICRYLFGRRSAWHLPGKGQGATSLGGRSLLDVILAGFGK